jgi:hypothetical protein
MGKESWNRECNWWIGQCCFREVQRSSVLMRVSRKFRISNIGIIFEISCLWWVEDIIDRWGVQISKVELSVQGLKRFVLGKAIRFLLIGIGEAVHWVL